MENASKALIIAGAILIAIVLIAVGVLVVNNMNEPVEQGVAGMDDQAKQIFNRKFESYENDTQNANNVRALLSAIRSSNTSTTQINKVDIKFTEKGGTVTNADGSSADFGESAITTIQGKVTTAYTYDVNFNYTDGVITSVDISAN